MLPFIAGAGAAAAASLPRRLYVGSYAPLGQGLYGFALDAQGGSPRPLGLTPNPLSPSWLLADAAAQRVYAAEEGGDHISVYEPQSDGSLLALQRLPSGGRGPVHLSQSHGRIWVAHYGDARLAALEIQVEGRLAAARSWSSCVGDCRPGPSRPAKAPPGSQANSGHDAPHAHMLQASPDGRWLLASDLGRDVLLVWPLPARGELPGRARELQLSAGSGPRHFVFHPSDPGRVYLLQETSSTLSSIQLGEGGARLQDEISVLPAGFAGTSYASDLLLAPDGRHLYAFNRLHDSLAVISLADPQRPRLLEQHWTHGSYPRSACIVGAQLYVCNQRSDQLSHFDLSDPARPRFSGLQIAVPSPATACAL